MEGGYYLSGFLTANLIDA